MNSYKEITDIISRSGIWKGERRNTHAFALSPDVFTVSKEQRKTLEDIGPLLRTVMAGASRILGTAINPDLGATDKWCKIRQMAELDVQKTQVKMQRCFPQRNPLITKVDLIEAEDGRLYIGEIDAMNRRAMGYASLFAQIAQVVQPTGERPVGVGHLLQRVVSRMGTAQLLFVYGDQERFYLPEFEILKMELQKYQIDLVLLSEMDIQRVEYEDRLLITTTRDSYIDPVLINIPEFHKQMKHAESFSVAYARNMVRVLIPPKPFLGSKGLLALLSNATFDETYESIVRSQIHGNQLNAMRRLIPTTSFIQQEQDGAGKILKQMISSGAKGIVFPDDSTHQTILGDRRGRSRYVAQEMICGRRRVFRRFVSPDSVVEELRYTRLVAYYIDGALAEVVVTATINPCVHGGPSAINMGVVYAE